MGNGYLTLKTDIHIVNRCKNISRAVIGGENKLYKVIRSYVYGYASSSFVHLDQYFEQTTDRTAVLIKLAA